MYVRKYIIVLKLMCYIVVVPLRNCSLTHVVMVHDMVEERASVTHTLSASRKQFDLVTYERQAEVVDHVQN